MNNCELTKEELYVEEELELCVFIEAFLKLKLVR